MHLRTSPTVSLLWGLDHSAGKTHPCWLTPSRAAWGLEEGGQQKHPILRSLESVERNEVWALGGL